jgi:hypothetical protein
MSKYYANPYSTNHSGFYFEDYDDFWDKIEPYEAEGVEEFEIEFIDGPAWEGALFTAAGINQSNLKAWFDIQEDLEEHDAAVLYYLTSMLGYDLDVAAEKLEDAYLRDGSKEDYVYEMANDAGGWTELLGDNVDSYIDAAGVARDMEINGEIAEFDFGGSQYTIAGLHGL